MIHEPDTPIDAESKDPSAVPHGELTGPCFLLFFIPLTIPLRLEHGSIYSFQREEVVEWLSGIDMHITADTPPIPRAEGEPGRNFVSLRIWRPLGTREGITLPFDRAMAVLQEATGHDRGERPKNVSEHIPTYAEIAEEAGTVIEALTPLLATDGGNTELAVSLAFDRCIAVINLLITAFILASGDPLIGRISRQNLYPFIPWAARNPDGEIIGGPGMFFPGPLISTALAFGGSKAPVDHEVMRRLNVYLRRIRQGDPFANYLEWARNSRHELDIEGDTAAAVNAAHTAGEILLDTLLYLMAWEEGLSYEEAAQWFEHTGSAGRLRIHYHPRLGGRWSPDDPTTINGKWVTNVSRVRGRVVHAGYRPAEEETVRALDTLAELEEFTKERLAHKRLSYKRTALILLGTPGLDRRGLYSGQIKRFVEQEASYEEDWIASYRRWLNV